MTALLAGLWVFFLVWSLARRQRPPLIILVPIVLPPPPPVEPASQGEAWLRKQLDRLGKERP